MVVGLTGGLASGKSLVAGELRRLGAVVIDADEISREVTRPGMPAYRDIVERFGSEFLKEDGTIDRKRLGRYVFSHPEALSTLNSLTHPRILDEIERRIKGMERTERRGIIVVDAPLLFEVGLHRRMDRVIVVYADEERQIERLIKRDHLTREEATRRIKTQMPLSEKIKRADFVIDNNGTEEETLLQTQEVFERLKAEAL